MNLMNGSEMTTELTIKSEDSLTSSSAWEKALVANDLSALNPDERVQFVNHVCKEVGLNPSTHPFIYITYHDKLTLYPAKGATEQLRQVHKINVEIVKTDRNTEDGVIWVHVRATSKDRFDEDFGWAAIANLKGDQLGNAVGKAITKAKRRVTLSMVGLGWVLPDDESDGNNGNNGSSGVSGNLSATLAAPIETEEKPKKKRTRKKKKEDEDFKAIDHPKVELDTGIPKTEQSTQEELAEVHAAINSGDTNENIIKAEKLVKDVKEVFNEPDNDPREEIVTGLPYVPEPTPEPEIPKVDIKPINANSIDLAMDYINKIKKPETLDLMDKRVDVSTDLEEGSVTTLRMMIDARREELTNQEQQE